MSDDYTNALAKFLQSEKNAFAEPQRMLWPFRKDPYTGDMGLGHSMVTESLVNGLQFPAKAMSGKVPMFSEYEDGKVHWSPEWMQGANDTAGLAMTGAIGLPKPQNALGSGGGGKMVDNALPMDQASRMARAKEMGFDTDRIVHHGTMRQFDNFEGQAPRSSTVVKKSGPQFHTTSSRQEAEQYGDTVLDLYLRGKFKPTQSIDKTHDTIMDRLRGIEDRAHNGDVSSDAWEKAKRFLDYYEGDDAFLQRLAQREIKIARGEGFDGVKIAGGFGDSYAGDHYIAFDPSNIRSVNAAFDPAKTSSSNLLASNPREGAAAAQMTNVGQREATQGIKAYHGSPHDFDQFDVSNPAWFSTSEATAKEFGKDRMGFDGPRSSYYNASSWGDAKPHMYEVSIDGSKLMPVDVIDEALKTAKIAGVDAPSNWDEVAIILDWSSAQKDWVHEAQTKGFGGVKFSNVGDSPSGIESHHIAVTDPKIIEILRKYGLLPPAVAGASIAGQTPVSDH